MKDRIRLDLHMHTTVSDGTDTPGDILDHVRAEGLELFSVTDHDAVKGCNMIRQVLTKEDPRFITGVEFSCKDEKGKYHILGYGYDPDAPAINQVIEKGHQLRINKVRKRLDFLEAEFGFSFPAPEIDKLFRLDNPGKPHIGNLMAKYQYARSKDEAITKYINQIRFGTEYIRPEEAIEGILGGGGIPVLAHPSYGSGEEIIMGEDLDSRLKDLMDYGLQGVEAFYSGFTAKIQNEVLAFAETYHLYVTAGSDYHGTNKLVKLGDTNLDSVSEYPEGLRRFLETVNIL